MSPEPFPRPRNSRPGSSPSNLRIRNKLQASFLFSALEPHELEIVIGAMEEKQYKPGEPVIKQGDEGDNLYVVEAGSLACTKRFVRFRLY